MIEREPFPGWDRPIYGGESSRGLRISAPWVAILLGLLSTIGGVSWKIGALSSKVDGLQADVLVLRATTDYIRNRIDGLPAPARLPLTATSVTALGTIKLTPNDTPSRTASAYQGAHR